jgi:TP901 family phage tail tape measure protein
MGGGFKQIHAALKQLAPVHKKFLDSLSGNPLVRAGKNLQWVGRQLIYNFTLPLGLAGVALFKFNQDLERSRVRIRKVYGDLSMDAATANKELKALDRTFELLSTRFGVHQVEVLDIAAAWAQAGSAGAGLGNNVKATLEMMILGEMEAVEATEALIAIQAAWQFSTIQTGDGLSELGTHLAMLNIIENETAINMEGLIDVFVRSGSMARTAGLEFQELAALAAALVPATGSAANAGNALRTILARLVSPTQDMEQVLGRLGITVTSDQWMGRDAVEKLQLIAKAFSESTLETQNFATRILSSGWQVNRFTRLMADLNDENGIFAKAMEATSDQVRTDKVYQQELQAVLESSPRKWDIMTNAIRNSMAKAFLPLMPVIMSVIQFFAQMADGFAKLSDTTRKIILLGAAFVFLVGPLLAVVASFAQLMGVLGGFVTYVSRVVIVKAIVPLASALIWLAQTAVIPLIRLFIGQFVAAIAAATSGLIAMGVPVWALAALVAAAVAAIILILDDDLRENVFEIVESIGRAFAQLPGIFARALEAVARVVADAVTQIWEMLQYLNPFARHSPSLVDNVTAGISTILDQFERLRGIRGAIFSATQALDAFGMAVNPKARSFREQELREQASTVSAAVPGSGGPANAMVDSILQLEAELPNLAREIAAQNQVVGVWERSLAAADNQLRQLEVQLESSRDAFESVAATIEAANNRIAELAETPIEGMTAMEDQIFENEMAQKRLRLELLKFEQAGISIDEIKDKYAALNGEIELLRGEQGSLRAAGAGSDILSVYDAQIQALEDQRGGLTETARTIQDIQDQLDALDLEGRFLELTKSINFDPLERQIERLVHGVHEMPFDQILAQIQEQQAIVAALTPEYDRLAAQVEREEAAVEAARDGREAINAQLDLEQDKLDQLEQSYSDIQALIRDMEGALTSMVSSIEADLAKIKEPDFIDRMMDAAALAEDMEIFGGDTVLGPEGDLFDIEALNKQLEDDIAKMLEDMGVNLDFGTLFKDLSMDLFDKITEPFRKAWERVKELASGVVDWFRDHWTKILLAALALPMLPILIPAAIIAGLWVMRDKIFGFFQNLASVVGGWAYDNIILPIARTLEGWGQWLSDHVFGPFVGALTTLYETGIRPVIDAIQLGFEILGTVISTAWDVIVAVISTSWDVISAIFGAIWDALDGFLIPIFTLFYTLGAIAWELLARAIQIHWDAIQIIWDALVWVVQNILIPVFQELWDFVVLVWNDLGTEIQWVWRNLIEPAWNALNWVVDHVLIPAFEHIRDFAGAAWDAFGTGLEWTMDHIIRPVFDGFRAALGPVEAAFRWLYESVIQPIWNIIVEGFQAAWRVIGGVIEGGVNFFVDMFNLLARAVNAIADLLGVDARVTLMEHIDIAGTSHKVSWPALPSSGGGGGGSVPKMATGGIVGAAGGAFTGARAIVGEGSNRYPEYVIPTDPRYAHQAMALQDSLNKRLRHGDGFGIGDVFDAGIGFAKGALGKLSGWVREGAVKLIWDPLKSAANAVLNQIPVPFLREGAKGLLDRVDSWISGVDQEWEGTAKGQMGGVFGGAGSWRSVTDFLARIKMPHSILSTYRPGATTRYTGNTSWHALDRAVDLAGPTGMINYSPTDLLAINRAIYDRFKPDLKELIYGGPGAKNVFRGQDHQFSSQLLREHVNHVHAALARGGVIVPHTPGGTLMRVGEGLYDEAVQVRPLHGDNEGGDGETHLHFYGDLEFPNIRTGADATALVKNLKAMV